MSKYTEELKEKIIKEYIENKAISYGSLSKKYTINKGTIKVLSKKYRETEKIKSSSKGRKKRYSKLNEI